MKKNSVSMAMGASRASLAANIMMKNSAWESYSNLHETVFATNGLKKFVALDADGKIIARNALSSDVVTNASTLRHEDFLTIQDMITEVRRRKLNGIQDLLDAGLDFPVDIGDQIVGTENVSEFGDAEQDQNPESFDDDESEFSEIYVPNPITHKSFSIPWRQQGFAYKQSVGLKESMRKVAERLEKTLFLGNDQIKVNFNGVIQSIFGYTNHPSRGTTTISDWSATANNDLIVNEVIAAIAKMFSEQGGVEMDSVVLYYPKNFKGALDRDYVKGFPSKTVRDRLKDIPEIKDIKFAEYLPDSNVIFVELSDRTIQLAKASDIVTVPHLKTVAMQAQKMTTYAAMVQIIKVDANSNTGILHAIAQ